MCRQTTEVGVPQKPPDLAGRNAVVRTMDLQMAPPGPPIAGEGDRAFLAPLACCGRRQQAACRSRWLSDARERLGDVDALWPLGPSEWRNDNMSTFLNHGLHHGYTTSKKQLHLQVSNESHRHQITKSGSQPIRFDF